MQGDARDAQDVLSAFERWAEQRARLAQDAIPREELRRHKEQTVKLQDNAGRCFPVDQQVSQHSLGTLRSKMLRVISQDHSATQESLCDLKDLISGAKEDLEDQLDTVRHTISAADASLRGLLEEDQARLQSSLESIAQAQQIADTTRPKVTIEENCAGEGSRAIFGTDTSQPGFNLTVARNEVAVGAVSSAGVHSAQTLQALLQHSRTPDLALALQALQTQSPNVRGEAAQVVLNDISAERGQAGLQPPTSSLLTEPDSLYSSSDGQPINSVRPAPGSLEMLEN